ncbi:MAG: hypothetical protein ACI378_06060 [Bacteroides sp.]
MDTTFNIFRYELVKVPGMKDLFEQQDEEKHYDTPNDVLESFFVPRNSELKIYNEKKGEWQMYAMEVLRLQDHVALVTLENNRTKTVIINKKDEKVQHHPWCRFVVDFREEQQMLVVECSSAFGTDGKALCRLLEQGLDNCIEPYHLNIRIHAMRKKQMAFWDTLKDIVQLFGDRVTQVKFDFEEMEDEQLGQSRDRLVEFLVHMARQSGCQAAFLLDTKKDQAVPIEQIKEDLTYLAHYCLEHPRYKLFIRFRNYGFYRVGKELEARFIIDEQMLEDFESNAASSIPCMYEEESFQSGISLGEWLKRIRLMLSDYSNEPVAKRRRKKRNR